VTEIIRTEGVVLKRRDFRETSRLVVAYTRHSGKVHLLARGARRPRNKFGAALEPLTRTEFVFYWREGKDLFTLAEATPLAAGRHLRENASALLHGLAVAEAADRLSAEGDAEPALYELLVTSLAALEEGVPPAALLTQFLFKSAAQLGYKPELEACAECGRTEPPAGRALLVNEGTVVCRECVPAAVKIAPLAPATYKYVKTLFTLSASSLTRVKIGPELVDEALAFIRAHLRFHTGLEIKSLSLQGFP
jgi:DNA repair protein RecO (recombination protein O)